MKSWKWNHHDEIVIIGKGKEQSFPSLPCELAVCKPGRALPPTLAHTGILVSDCCLYHTVYGILSCRLKRRRQKPMFKSSNQIICLKIVILGCFKGLGGKKKKMTNSINCAGQLVSHLRKIMSPCLTSYVKINSTCNKCVNSTMK